MAQSRCITTLVIFKRSLISWTVHVFVELHCQAKWPKNWCTRCTVSLYYIVLIILYLYISLILKHTNDMINDVGLIVLQVIEKIKSTDVH